MPADSLDTIRALVADVCAVDKKLVKPEAKLVGYGLDSVRLLDLILALEDAFGISINESDPELATVATVADLAGLVERRRAQAR